MRRYVPIIFLLILLIGLGMAVQKIQAEDSVRNYETIVKDYPALPACEGNTKCVPGEKNFGLPQFIKYVYIFGIGLVGFVALIAVMIGAFGYITSTGNPQKASHSKDQIFAALFGMLLLLGSVVILNLINPDLLRFSTEPLDEVTVVVTNPSPTGCQYTRATFAPSILNAGRSAILTFYRKNCTKEEMANTLIELRYMHQTSPGLSSDLDCTEMVNDAWKNIVKNTDTEFALKFTFNKKCNEKTVGWNCKWGGLDHPGPIVCNMIKDKSENFYIEKAEIKIPNKPTHYMPRIDITVNDGR